MEAEKGQCPFAASIERQEEDNLEQLYQHRREALPNQHLHPYKLLNTAKMVAMYTIAGRQVGSHVVRPVSFLLGHFPHPNQQEHQQQPECFLLCHIPSRSHAISQLKKERTR